MYDDYNSVNQDDDGISFDELWGIITALSCRDFEDLMLDFELKLRKKDELEASRQRAS